MIIVRVYNGSDIAITVVTDGNPDVIIQPKNFADVPDTDAVFGGNDFGFYVEEEGQWYAKRDNCHTGADVEIYLEK